MTRPDNRHLARIIVGLTRSGYAEDQINAVEELLNKYHPATEDKKAPVDETAEKIWDNYSTGIPEDDYEGAEGIAKLVAGKDIMYKDDFFEAMQEYASQERNRAIQECIDKVKEFYSHSYVFEELEKLKK